MTATQGLQRVGLQLWTLRERGARAFAATLEAVAGLGFAGVEHVDSLAYGGLEPREVRRLSDQLGLAAVGLHVELGVLERELDRVLADCAELGTPYLACAWTPPERRRHAEDYRRLAASLEAVGERCRDAGRRLLYHHHDFELRPVEGTRTGLDVIRETTTPDLVGLELDVYWLAVAGLDPVTELRRAGARTPLVHLKDVAAKPDPRYPVGEGLAHRTTEVGAGTLDLPGILAASAATAAWYLVEQDFTPGEPLESARLGLRGVEAALGGDGP